jgi:hypothetical protein
MRRIRSIEGLLNQPLAALATPHPSHTTTQIRHTQSQFGTISSQAPEFDAAAENIDQGQAAAAIQVTSLADRIRAPFPGSNDMLYSTLPSGEAWPNLKLLRKVGYDNGYSRLVTMPRRGEHPRQA